MARDEPRLPRHAYGLQAVNEFGCDSVGAYGRLALPQVRANAAPTPDVPKARL